ncbi:MAG: gamma-glutamyltransferase family protein [Acidimicrobiia bacterium]|nr:gamma-glutamyltransferase family protein [Acidimicrobiia bacterium]
MSRVTIASGSQLSADAGAAIADAGGNAVDAAIGAAIVSMCTEPGIIAPGASGYLTIWDPESEPVVIDAYAEMPGRGLRPERFGQGGTEVHIDYGGGMTTVVGAGSVATPGAFAGFGVASERFGAVPWEEILRPAVDVAETGFPISSASGQYLVYSHEKVFGWQQESYRAIHHPDGRPLQVGETAHIPGLAASLSQIGQEGPDSLYTGSLGQAIADAIQRGGGLLNADDLAAYEAIVREPVRITIDDWDVVTNPPPAVGGAALAAMLLLVDDHPFREWTTDELTHLIEAQRAVFEYRVRELDEVADRSEPAQRLLEAARLGEPGRLLDSPSTIHTSAVDGDGLACAVTVSAGYGSGLMVPGTGLWMNNSLGEVELNRSGFHAQEPGARLISNMAPTVARHKDGTVLAIGSPGADRITSALCCVLVNFLHVGMSLSDSIDASRVHYERFQGVPTVSHEPGLAVEAPEGLELRRFPDKSMYFGGVQAALFSPAAGLYANADPRRAGGTARGGVA